MLGNFEGREIVSVGNVDNVEVLVDVLGCGVGSIHISILIHICINLICCFNFCIFDLLL